MPDDKTTTLPDRVLGYGDDAVEKGKAATQTKVVPPPKPPPPPPAEVVTVILIDRRSLVGDAVRKVVKTRLETDLNALVAAKKTGSDLYKGLRVEARWESRAPSAGQQSSYGKWDFPIYFEKAHASDNIPASQVHEIMSAHGIRNAGKAADQFTQAEAGWKSKGVEGLGIQPLLGYRKVGFLKVDLIAGRVSDVETAYTNVVKHELGHMLNITDHNKSGLMLKSVPTADSKAIFAAEDDFAIRRELGRLQRGSETNMQRVYEQTNR
jgi:hypothetical protein